MQSKGNNHVAASTQELSEFLWGIDQNVRRGQRQRLRSEAIRDAAGPHSGSSAGEDVNRRVAHDERLLGSGMRFLQQSARSLRVGLFGRKTVPAVNMNEEFGHPQRFQDRP